MSTTERPSRIVGFFSNPIVGAVGSVASVISIPLAIYFYVAAQERREVVYAVNPTRTVLVEAGRPSELQVEFRGQPITKVDVVAAQALSGIKARRASSPIMSSRRSKSDSSHQQRFFPYR
jgi:hypothetical protein